MATNGGPEKPAGGDKKPRDEKIAKAAAAVVAGGIAWSLFRTVQMRITQEHTTTNSVSQEEKSHSLNGAPVHKKGLDFLHFGHKKQTNGNNTVIQVSAGDTLWGIARKYDVSVEALMASNGIQNGDSIAAGESLIVPK